MAKELPHTPESVQDQRTTLQDVARKAGVHHTTVSRALRDDPQISQTVRERVRAMAQEMGYEPDPMLQALARYRGKKRAGAFHGTLAWLTNLPRNPESAEPKPHDHFSGAVEAAAQKGYHFECLDFHSPGMTTRKIRRILIARGIRGILLPPQKQPGTKLEMDFSGFSVVTIGNTLESPRFHRVGPDQYENSRGLTARLLAEPGLRAGFYIPAPIDERADGTFSAGFWRAQECVEASRRIKPFLPSNYSERDFIKWFRAHKMDVLVTTPQPAMEWFGRAGIRVPEDVMLAFPGDANDPWVGLWMQENWPEIYRAAVDLLVSQLEGNRTGIPAIPRRILIEGELVDRRPKPKRTRKNSKNPK